MSSLSLRVDEMQIRSRLGNDIARLSIENATLHSALAAQQEDKEKEVAGLNERIRDLESEIATLKGEPVAIREESQGVS